MEDYRSNSYPDPLPRRPAKNPARTTVCLRKILVPIDFMESTISAMKYAASLAREHQAGITLLHCLKADGPDARRTLSREQLCEELTAAAESQIAKLVEIFWGSEIATEIVIATGKPHEQIVNEAREMNSDLIIMGGHGAVGSWGLFRKNTTAKVVCHAPCPVLVVRAFSMVKVS